jgi:hypothetical protein
MNDELAGWKSNAAQMGIAAMWLKTFASEIIGHVLNGHVLDDAAVQNIKAKCVRELKNLDVVGVDIAQEADLVGKSLQLFEQMADMAIADGWKLKNM